MADQNFQLSITQVRAAYQRALSKIARQRSALAATEAEVAVWEKAIKDAEAADAKGGKK